MEQTVCKISCEKMSVDQLSMMGVAKLQSNTVMGNSSCSSMSEEKSSMMSVAELQSYERIDMVKKCYCVIGQSESSDNKCTVCTVENGQSATNLAASRIIKCISTSTKGGPSSVRGGGHELKVIQQFEENLHGKTEKQNITHSTDSTEKISFVSSISSKKTLIQDRKFGNMHRVNNTTTLVNITPTKRKLSIDQNIHSLISSFEDTAANHLRTIL